MIEKQIAPFCAPPSCHAHPLKEEAKKQFALEGHSGKIFVVTVPKSGTHLLAKILRSLNIDFQNRLFHFTSEALVGKGPFFKNQDISIVEHIHPRHKYIVNVRDPRDNLISFIRHFSQGILERNPKHAEFAHLPMDQKIDFALGIGDSPFNQTLFAGFERRVLKAMQLALELKQAHLKNVHFVKFEDIIRPAAGGASNQDRFKTFSRLCEFATANYTSKKIKEVMKSCWGDSPTFRAGDPQKVSQWEKYFKPRHIQQFKAKYNDLLLGLGYETDPNWDEKYLSQSTSNLPEPLFSSDLS